MKEKIISALFYTSFIMTPLIVGNTITFIMQKINSK